MINSWFVFSPDVIAGLAELTLEIVFFVYFLNLKNKSRDTWLFTIFFLVEIIYNIWLVAYYGVADQGARAAVELIHYSILAATFLYNLWFVYEVGGNVYPREQKVMLVLFAILVASGIYFYQNYSKEGVYLPYIPGFFWSMMVVYRKKRRFEKADIQAGEPQRKIRLFRSLFIWSLLLFIIWINVNLGISGPTIGIHLPWWFLSYSIHPMYLISITYSAILGLDYAVEKTSFLAKLVGVVLCIILIILGLVPLILINLIGHDHLLELRVQHMLMGLASLIPVTAIIILLALPLLFRNHLLSALKRVLNGLHQVNAGDLSAAIPVEVNDEIGALTRHFNKMTASLRAYSNEMETLVNNKTVDLQQSLEELRSTQAQLIQSEKMASLGELTAGIAHEIQNPLNFVNNFSELNTDLIQELKGHIESGNSNEANTLVNDIEENEKKIVYHGKRAEDIVNGMLQHSRASTGMKEATNINALADEFLRLSYHGLRAKDKSFNAIFSTHFDKSIGNVSVSPQDIGRVLLNLFTNAFYSVNEKRKSFAIAGLEKDYEPKVSVTTKKLDGLEEGQVEIRVKDNGVGISIKILDKIYQPFFTTKPAGRGTGLGLSLSYDIIKAHGGEIKVETKEGEGAEFTIVL